MYSKVLSLLALAGAAQSHMSIFYPPPLGGAPSINKESTSLDSEFNFPLGCCGSDGGPTVASPGICRGHLDKFDTEEAQVTWEAGQDAYFQLTDYSYDPNAPGGTHSGGSCQVGFSVDKGVTWKVAASYHGACPHETTDGSPEAQTFDFKVPTGIPEGDVLFGWTWLNREHESFMNCAKVKIGAGSGNSTTPSQPSSTSTQPEQPYQSETTPEQPTQTQEPDDSEPTSTPAPTSATGRHPHRTKTAASTEPTSTPDDTSDSEDDSEDSDDSDSDSDSDSSDSDSDDSDSDSDSDWSWSGRPHRKVKTNTRRYTVDGTSCECRRDELTLAARCSCDASAAKRGEIERKALRLHRRTMVKRTDACDWATAPAMEVSYYTEDANCAPNAKLNMPESDDFELKWDVSCGVVEGGSEYSLKLMECNMYGA
ncbi:hypothetical protein N0V83_003624 [Neocucurbitaria cava]|uniref:Lytic polysaccharide monooxygenase n=1 Tax=Neocucurbitaria cava TaxID=798079 RepID=A0A9W8YEU6_9PLEO|nr:hypothetical protein N0V83_003624 [Neocucurbitaria cava]